VTGSSLGERIVAARGAGRMTIGLRGEFESAAAEALLEVATPAVNAGMDLVVDMIEVTAIQAEGLAALDAVGILARTRTGDGSFLVRPPVANRDLYDAVVAVAATSFELARLEGPPPEPTDRRRTRGERP